MASERDSVSEFETISQEKSGSLIGEFFDFLRENRKWWLLPIIIVFLLISALMVLSSTAIAPFIYTLF